MFASSIAHNSVWSLCSPTTFDSWWDQAHTESRNDEIGAEEKTVAAYSILDSALSRLKVNTSISQHSVIQTNPFMNTLITSTCGFRSFPSRLLFQISALEKAPESLPFGEWRWKLCEQAREAKIKTVFLAFNYDLINKQFETQCAHYKRRKHRRVSVITRHFNFVLFPWGLSFTWEFLFWF